MVSCNIMQSFVHGDVPPEAMLPVKVEQLSKTDALTGAICFHAPAF